MTELKIDKQQIEQVLLREIECARLLMDSLQLEYDALADHHVVALEEIVRDKHERIQQLESVSRQREKLLASSPGANSVTDKHPPAYPLQADRYLNGLWNELVDIAEKCREKNRINGRIVEQVSKQSRYALDILRGILPDSSPVSEVYDNSGQTSRSANKRSIVQV